MVVDFPAPVGPVIPATPVAPAGPVAPVGPTGPVGPVGPVAPVPPGGTTTMVVRFAPTASGTRTAALHLTSNDGAHSPFDFALTGVGNTPPPTPFSITATPGSGDFSAPALTAPSPDCAAFSCS